MKIMHFVSSAASGGAEIYVRDLSICMAKNGHEVFIVFLDRAKETGRDINFEEEFIKTLKKHDINFGFIGKLARKRPWLGFFRLKKFVNDFSPDVLHCHLYYAVVFSYLIREVKVVYTHHNIKIGVPKIVFKLLDKRVNHYIGICLACTNMLKSLTGNPISRIDNGVPLERIKKKELPKDQHDKRLRLISVGTLSKQKNLELAIRSLINCNNQEYEYIIVGEGSQKSKLEGLVNDLGASDRIKFYGNSSRVAEQLKEADVFIMSSAWEGLPIALLEATLTGLPVIVTNVGGCAEIVHKVCNGIIVDELNEKEFTAALERLIEGNDLRCNFQANALNYANFYSLEESVKKHLLLYKELMGNSQNERILNAT